jgi:hypothetical protein
VQSLQPPGSFQQRPRRGVLIQHPASSSQSCPHVAVVVLDLHSAPRLCAANFSSSPSQYHVLAITSSFHVFKPQIRVLSLPQSSLTLHIPIPRYSHHCIFHVPLTSVLSPLPTPTGSIEELCNLHLSR